MQFHLILALLGLISHAHCSDFDEQLDEGVAALATFVGECSDYFQYVRSSEGYIIGNLTLPNIKHGDNVALEFKTELLDPAPGIFLPDGSPEMILDKLQNNATITYRLDFPFHLTLPQLKSISINDNELCRAITMHNLGVTLVFRHLMQTLDDGTLKVYKNNIHMPHFATVESFTCGHTEYSEITKNKSVPFIYGGTPIQRGEFPWLTAIYKKQITGINFICGGSLLNANFILTAAHCIQDNELIASNILVYIGRHRLTGFSDNGILVRDIESVNLHPDYNPKDNLPDADLAILKMMEPVGFTNLIQPICLWNEPADETAIVNETGIVVGWGSIQNGSSLSDVPKKVRLNIVSELECIRSSLGLLFLTTSRTLCAGKRDGTGPCKGDSGGGLMLNRNGIWMLRGVVSIGLTYQERCDLQEYTVYTDVAKHRNWLNKEIGRKELDNICGITSGDGPRSGFEWLAAIYFKSPVGENFFCSGVLISSRSVLTSAHCIDASGGATLLTDFLRVYLRRFDLGNIEESGVITRDVSAVIRHPSYRLKGRYFYDFDIALMQLKTAVSFTDTIKPICLWSSSINEPQIVQQVATLSSWNLLRVFNETLTVPESMENEILPFERCQQSGYNESKLTQFLCTPHFSDNFDGILMLNRSGRWFVRGVASANGYFRDELALRSLRVYTDISQYLSWIRQNMSL